MKNRVLQFLSLTATLFLASSFVSKPVQVAALSTGTESIVTHSEGGAFVMFAGKLGGEITLKEITAQTELKVEGCAKGARIVGFTLFVTKNCKTSSLTTTSHVLTAAMRLKLKSLTKGDGFEFRHTKAYLPNGKDMVDVRGDKFLVVL